MADATTTPTRIERPRNAALPEAWRSFLRAHSALTRQMDADLIASHGITLSDYGVLLRLAQSPERRMRRVDLADEVMLTQSGITRLLAGLEEAGWVERATCDTDRRVVYAQLTDAGHEKYRAAGRTHLESIRMLFADHFSGAELELLEELMGRLPLRPSDLACGPD